ncbi:uncharacterized protein [Littorina saxatilis]|uniref:uncharacterized protein isoform X2 n=1 Tax=Littorina saxatilis TaxID=31220 RepID=UPI0038B4C0FC
MHITQGPAVECAPPCSTSGSPGNQAASPAPPLMARSQESEDQVLRLSDHEREFLNAWFPHLESESYIIPPAHMDTVHERMAYTGESERIQVLKTQQQIDIDESIEVRGTVHIDRVLKNVHHCMNQIKDKAAREKEIMVILTQAKLGVYGADTQSIYTGAAARNTNSVKAEPLNLKEDFVDLIVIHRERGIMMAAIIPQTEDDPLAVQEELKKAAAYLKQARDVVRRSVLGDLVTQPALHQAIVLPDTTRRCLEEVLENMSDELQEGLSVESGRNVSHVCLCEDDMADQTRLDAWWRASLERNEGGDHAMDTATYTQLVARFSIPLTTIELFLSRQPRLQLWTQGHLVHAVGMEHGRPMSCIALFPQQFQVLEEPPDDYDVDVRILWGPTGTSKSIVLIIKGLFLLRKGCATVFVLQTSDDGAAAAYLVGHQVRETAGQGAGSVQLVNMAGVRYRDSEGQYHWTWGGEKKVQAWVEELCQHAQTHGRVHILADEAECDVIAEIYRALKQRHVRFTLWAAGVKLRVPADMKRHVRYLTQPLRSPPAVVREVEQADDMKRGTVPAYTRPPVSAPCDGPPVLTVDHYDDWYRGDRQGHEGNMTWRCARCGELVADMLRDLRVGCQDNAPHGQGGLTFSDVFVLGGMKCDRPDGNILSPAPFIRGLESRGVPTRKVAHNDTEAVRQLAEMTSGPTQRAAGRGRDEAVTVANEDTVWGLERPVVVYLDGGYGLGNNADPTGRLRSMSRSTAQVIWVKDVET